MRRRIGMNVMCWNIKAIRENKELTIEYVSEVTGYSESNLRSIESPSYVISGDKMLKRCEDLYWAIKMNLPMKTIKPSLVLNPQWMRIYRRSLKLTQWQLADIAETLSRGTIQRIENGSIDGRHEQFSEWRQAMCEALRKEWDAWIQSEELSQTQSEQVDDIEGLAKKQPELYTDGGLGELFDRVDSLKVHQDNSDSRVAYLERKLGRMADRLNLVQSEITAVKTAAHTHKRHWYRRNDVSNTSSL